MADAREPTVAGRLTGLADSQQPALHYDGESWTYHQLVAEASRRGRLFEQLRSSERPPHIGVLLDNGPEYLFWLSAAALTGSTLVGINSTYRGDQLAALIRHTDCQLLVTSDNHLQLLSGLDTPLPPSSVLNSDTDEFHDRVSALSDEPLEHRPSPEELFLLIFTSGSTGLPKAVRCTQGRHVRTGTHVAGLAGLNAQDAVYAPLPFFHSASLFTGWASALAVGASIATRPKFSASNALPDIRRYGATLMAYTGKILNYMLATDEAPDDSENPLKLAIGNEASTRDIREFARRFGCDVRDSYGSTEGIIIIRRDAAMPTGALGTAGDSVKVLSPKSGVECPPIAVGAKGELLNIEDAVGEIVETAPSQGFEGYYKNESATSERFRDGQYWSGDLAYRDRDGWLYFAGRSNDWLRVDGENFAAAPVEAIILRHPDIRSAAVYAVPDDPVGDRVMAAIELLPGSAFDPAGFDAFLKAQQDLGTKWAPAFLRPMSEIPKLASMKLDKMRLRREAWQIGDLYWRPTKGGDLRPLSESDRSQLERLLSEQHRLSFPEHRSSS